MAFTYLIRGLSPDTIERARARARSEGQSLAAVTKQLFEDYATEKPRDPAAMGKKGGTRRAANMTADERSAHARTAVQARWAKAKR